MEGLDSFDTSVGHDRLEDRPQTLEDLIRAAVSRARAEGWTGATPSMLTKALKPLVSFLCLGTAQVLPGSCPPRAVTRAGELYIASLDLPHEAVVECLIAAKKNGLVARHQEELLTRARRVVANLVPLTLEATREGEDIADATRKALPRDRHGGDGAIRDRSAMHARWRIIEHISTLDAWPLIDTPLKSDRLLGAQSGRPLTDKQVNTQRGHAATETAEPSEQLDFTMLLPTMQRIARELATNPEDAKDLVQDTAVRILTYRVTNPNVTFIRTTMKRLRADQSRRRARRPLLPGDHVLPILDLPREPATRIEALTDEVTRVINTAETPAEGMTRTEQIARQIAVAVLRRVLGDDEATGHRRARATLTTVLHEETERVSADLRAAATRRARLLLEIGANVVAGTEPPRCDHAPDNWTHRGSR